MSVSLAKGQKVSLTKQGGDSLTRVRMFGWDAALKKGLFGSRPQSIDLDAWSVVHASIVVTRPVWPADSRDPRSVTRATTVLRAGRMTNHPG